MTRVPLLFILAMVLLARQGWAGTVPGDPLADEEAFGSMRHVGEEASWQFGGFAESRNQFSLRDGDVPVSLRQRVQLELQWKKETLAFFASLEGLYEGAASTWPGHHSPWRAEVREAYLTLDTESVDVFLGKKIHRWGTGDGINPMDLINPVDMRDPFASGRADNRVPTWMISTTLSGNNVSLEGIFLPKAAVIRLPERGEPWEPAALRELRQGHDSGRYSLETSNKPDRWFEDVEFGGKLSTSLYGWDLSLMAFQGYAASPIFTPDYDDAHLTIKASHPSFTAVGTSFAKGLGSQTVRGEFAYKPGYPIQSDNGHIRADLWQGVMGWDYDIDGKYYLNFQYFADFRRSAPGMPSDTEHGFAYEVSGKWLQDALTTGFRGKVYCSGDGGLTEVFLEYDLDDHWNFYAGVMWWSGKGDSVLGEYKKNDMVYATVRYSF